MPENKKIQIVINKDIWRSAEELGDEIKRQDPDKYGHRNSHELGTKAVKSKPNLRIVPLEWGDMHPLTASGNVARDWWRSAKEDVEGGYEFAKAPIETSQAMGGAGSLLHEEVTAPKIRSLLESIGGISLKGLPQTAGPGHEPLGSRVNPEDKEAMRAAGTEFLSHNSIANSLLSSVLPLCLTYAPSKIPVRFLWLTALLDTFFSCAKSANVISILILLSTMPPY